MLSWKEIHNLVRQTNKQKTQEKPQQEAKISL